MADKLYAEFGDRIDKLTLISSAGGVFEVTVNGTLVFSKKATRRHATFEGVRDAIRAM